MPRRGRGGSFRQSNNPGNRRTDGYDGPPPSKSSFGNQQPQPQSNDEQDRKSHADEKESPPKDVQPKTQDAASSDDKNKQKQVLSASNSGRKFL